jgi:two-component system, NarL family, sensor kinase
MHLERTRLIVMLVTISIILLGVAFVGLHFATPSDGARLVAVQSTWRADGVVVTTLREQPGGLRTGDVVVAVDGTSLNSFADNVANPLMPRPEWHTGQIVTYTVLRDGARMDIPVTLGAYPIDEIWSQDWSTIVFALALELIALYIVARRPSDPGPLILLLSASGILSATTWSFGLQVSDIVGGGGFVLYKLTSFVAYMLFWIAGLHFSLVFPRPNPLVAGHPRRVALLYLTPYALYAVYLALARAHSASALEWFGNWLPGESILAAMILLLTVTSTAWNYRSHRDAETRTKIRWVVFGGLVSGILGLLLWNLPAAVLGHSLISTNALGLLVLPFPICIAIAILRHRLFDIDTILNRTLVYGGLSALVALIYIAIVAMLSTTFRVEGNLLISLVAAGIVAVAFQPLRIALQRVVDRLLFGERDNPYAVLSRLGQRLEVALAPDAVLPTIAETVAQTLKLPSATIAISTGDQLTPEVEYGLPMGAPVTFPLIYQSELVGQLRVSQRGPEEPFTEAEKRLLRDIAHQAGIAVHASRLTTDLQRSRERLVTTREEERRRLRRDLHDGIGPTLAGMALKVGATRNLLAHDPPAADRLLGELSAEIETAIADIRRLVYALRPPALDELGLVAALRAQAAQYEASPAPEDHAGSGFHVTIEAPANIPPLPAAVEVAAYRIASEALTNAARYAHAKACCVRLTLDSALYVEITDDGVGLSEGHRTGVGLISMRERAEELGGTCAISTPSGGGTLVLAALPLSALSPEKE